MDKRPATLETDDTTPHGDVISHLQPQIERVKGMRFTYPSGSRPLEGYTIKRGIGIGGFGEVYFALSDAGKEVALKRIQRNLDIELRGVRQCLNLKHINLISLWDIRTSDHGESWVVMEYVPGESLRDVIEKNAQGMPIHDVHGWFCAMAAGVDYLHDRGIVHRDLKPGNIFRDDDEEVIKIGDYGLSKFISCSNRDGQTESVGTFHYMAPEIGKGVYGKEIDIYAMGIILFEMLTGRVPFEGESSREIIMKHLTALPDLQGLNQPYQRIIRRALEKDPDRRFNSVGAMVELLRAPADAIDADPPMETSSKRVPPIQPMFIGEQTHYAGDDEIKFGEVRQVVDAQVSSAGGPVSSSGAGVNSASVAAAAGSSAAASHRPPNEPIARAVHGGWKQVADWWNHADVSTPIKVVILVTVILLLLINSAWMIPTALALGLVYLIYYVIRTWTLPNETPAAQRRKPTKSEITDHLRGHLAQRPLGDRMSELIGSLVIAAIVCPILGLLALVVGANQLDMSEQQWAFYAWAVIISIFGSWCVLVVNKVWENRNGEQLVRRFVMVSTGLLIGFVGFFANQFLHLNWAAQPQFSDLTIPAISPDLFVSLGAPSLWGYLVFFAGLFFILRWWRQADPIRKTRLSILNVGLCLIWGVVIGQLFHFPLPWSCILAVMISVATQLAAPWLSPEKRVELNQKPLSSSI